MLLKIENLGMIEHAEVSLDGFTVIAGDNDTGKSTVGRLWFALIKALSRY
jgi:predicted ATPase